MLPNCENSSAEVKCFFVEFIFAEHVEDAAELDGGREMHVFVTNEDVIFALTKFIHPAVHGFDHQVDAVNGIAQDFPHAVTFQFRCGLERCAA